MRISKFDNIKCLGIFLIVLGHMLEAVSCGKIGDCLHIIIYSFHIPLFIFVMGYFARYKRYAALKVFILYLVIQTVYLAAFNVKHLVTGEYFRTDYTTPFWLAWFLMVMLIYKLITPLVSRATLQQKYLVLVCAVALALFSSCIPHLGYRFSLARAVTFLPYFIFGMIWKEADLHPGNKHFWLILACASGVFMSVQKYIIPDVLYGVTGTPLQRAINYITACIWIMFLMSWTPDRELSPTISRVGRNTLPVFLFHGLVIKVLFTFWEPSYGLLNILMCFGVSVLLCIALAHDKLTKLLMFNIKHKRLG